MKRLAKYQTGDNWYDAGKNATIQSTASGPFSLWSGASTIANANPATTTDRTDSYYTVTANFSVTS